MDINACLKGMAEELRKNYSASKIYLYGSHASHQATSDSDVDLLIIAPAREKFFKRIHAVKKILRKARQGLAVAPIVLTPQEVEARKKANDPFLNDIFSNGLLL